MIPCVWRSLPPWIARAKASSASRLYLPEDNMTQSELARYREMLLALARRVTGDVADLSAEALHGAGGEASGNLSDTPLHLADLGTDYYNQEVALSLLENEDQTLEAIRAAVDRTDDATFGRCVRCHKEIARERLDAVPFTPYCMACARALETHKTQ
jgi:DnaK suppressor protein